MLNVILDGFPGEYEGYLIRTDFRIGIQISEAMSDPNLAEPEKMVTAIRLLYGAGAPSDLKLASEGLRWFMSAGQPSDGSTSDNKPPIFDFEQDNRLVYSAFRARFGIDLTRERLHWFAFLAMFGDLSGCALSDIAGIRGTDLSQLSGAQQKRYAELQAKYRIKPQMSDGDLAKIAEFESKLG